MDVVAEEEGDAGLQPLECRRAVDTSHHRLHQQRQSRFDGADGSRPGQRFPTGVELMERCRMVVPMRAEDQRHVDF